MHFKNVTACPKFVLDVKMTNKKEAKLIKATSLRITLQH